MEDLNEPTQAPTMAATTAPPQWTYEDYQDWVRQTQKERAKRIYGGILFIFIVVALRVILGNLWGRYQRRRRHILAEEAAAKAQERRRTRIQNGLKFITWRKEKGDDDDDEKPPRATTINDEAADTSLSRLEEGALAVDKDNNTNKVDLNANTVDLSAADVDYMDDDEEGDNEASCAICFTSFEDGQVICGSNNPECPHMYCQECISSWLLQNSNPKTQNPNLP